jgi:hypothetical protein
MRAKFVFLFLLLTLYVLGQDFHNYSIVHEFIEDLSSCEIDTILIYEEGYLGGVANFAYMVDDSCHVLNSPIYSYILWRKSGKDFISKVSGHDACYDYKAGAADFDSLWSMYSKNKVIFNQKPLLPPAYTLDGDTVTFDIDHYPYSQIWLTDKIDTIEIEISEYQIQEIINGEFKNLNYALNRNSAQTKFLDLIHGLIENVECNNIIKRIRKTAYNTK